MKEIRLVPSMEYSHKLDVDVMDFPEGTDAKARKRCGITLDYGWRGIQRLEEEGLDLAGKLQHYENRIYELVKVNLAQDWICIGGMEEIRRILEKHLQDADVE